LQPPSILAKISIMRVALVLALPLLALSAPAQTIQPKPRQNLLNEPFSADAVTTLARTLADGTHITRQTILVKMYRDSAGRTRSDRFPRPLLASDPPLPATILITDPLAGYSYVLDTVNKIAHRSPLPKGMLAAQPIAFPQVQEPPPAPAGKARPQIKTEDLGTQFMEGLNVHGKRTIVTYPIGALGNDREIDAVTEIWSNTELGLMILQDRSDPRSGETITKLENVSRTQPDPALFQPPPDYKIVDAILAP
jgi:hypothetical protein